MWYTYWYCRRAISPAEYKQNKNLINREPIVGNRTRKLRWYQIFYIIRTTEAERSKWIDTTRRTYRLLMNNRYHSFREHFRLQNFNFLPLQFMTNQYRLVNVTCNVICKISVNIVAMYKKKILFPGIQRNNIDVTLEWKLLYIGVNKRRVYVAHSYN